LPGGGALALVVVELVVELPPDPQAATETASEQAPSATASIRALLDFILTAREC
jgi:hypothetical protein